MQNVLEHLEPITACFFTWRHNVCKTLQMKYSQWWLSNIGHCGCSERNIIIWGNYRIRQLPYKANTLYRHEIGWALRACVAVWVYVVMCERQMTQQHLSGLLLRVVNMLTLFLRRHWDSPGGDTASFVLSFYRHYPLSIIPLHCKSYFYAVSICDNIWGEEEIFARCINLFWKSTTSDTAIKPSELGGV